MGTFMVYPSQVVALVVPRNDTNTTISPVDSGGVSRLVETSIVVTLILAILFLLALHIFRKWDIFSEHIKWMFCCTSSSTSVTRDDRREGVNPIAHPHPDINDSSLTLTPSSAPTVKAEVQRPPKAQPRMATRDNAGSGSTRMTLPFPVS